MIISRIEARNFRCLRDVTMECDRLTALIGANGTGKSSVIRALEFFFGQLQLDALDCHNGDETLTVEVSLTFCDLPESLNDEAAAFLDEAGCLRLTRRSTPGDGGRQTIWAATRRKCTEFEPAREASSATAARPLYDALRDSSHPDLPAWKNKDQAFAALSDWESDHPEALTAMEDNSVTFGGGGLDLRQQVRPVFVRAVWEAAEEAAEGRTGSFSELIDLLVDPQLKTLGEDLRRLEESTAKEYGRIVAAHGDAALRTTEELLTNRLSQFVPNAVIQLEWEPHLPSLSGPRVKAKLTEAGFTTEVGRQGHGIQRAYLLALLQELNEQKRVSAGGSDPDTKPLLLLAIEEPELYQHPVQARMLARVLLDLARSDGTGGVQVVYATHSPFFVSLDRVDSLRVFRLASKAGAPTSEVARVDLEAAAQELWNAAGASGPPYTAETLKARLRLLMESPVSEGLFARAVVLVEGDEDAPIVKAASVEQGIDLDQLGISVLPVDGKSNIDRPYLIFKQLGIPTYVLFDGDADKGQDKRDVNSNKRLLRLLGTDEVEVPETQVRSSWACFKNDMKATLREEIGGAEFDSALKETRKEFGFARGGEKNPVVLSAVLARLRTEGRTSDTLSIIVRSIRSLVAPTVDAATVVALGAASR